MKEEGSDQPAALWNDVRDVTHKERTLIGFDNVRQQWKKAPAIYTDDTLTICGHPVMERWEDSYMKRLAEIATGQGEAVLEVGFGMGISARYIQERNPSHHIIVEANHEVAQKAHAFAQDANSTVSVMCAFWEDVVPFIADNSLSGILFDTYPLTEEEVHKNHFTFFNEAYRMLRPEGVLTYYSDEIDTFSRTHLQKLQEAGFKHINGELCVIDPPTECRYWKEKTILAPIISK